MFKNRIKKFHTILGVSTCVVITILFMIVYIFINYHTKIIDITSIPVVKEDDKKTLHIESVSKDDNGVLYVTAAAENTDINYDYFNWVLGEGNQVYKKMSILLIANDEETAYKLKTYPYSFQSQHNSISNELCLNNGILAYGDVKMLEDGAKKLAVLFEDMEGNSYILYPKEDYYINEK